MSITGCKGLFGAVGGAGGRAAGAVLAVVAGTGWLSLGSARVGQSVVAGVAVAVAAVVIGWRPFAGHTTKHRIAAAAAAHVDVDGDGGGEHDDGGDWHLSFDCRW